MDQPLKPAAIWGWVLVWGLALIGFLVMAVLASSHDTLPGDVWLAQHLQELKSPFVTLMVDLPEELSDPPLILMVWPIATTLVWVTIGWRQALLLVAAFILRSVNHLAKDMVGRPRPSLDLVSAVHQPPDSSFPSGHAQSIVLLYGLLFYFATVYIKRPVLRTGAQVLCLWVICFTAVERVYAGEHWPSDVVGGLLFGGLLLAVLIAADHLVFRRNRGIGSR